MFQLQRLPVEPLFLARSVRRVCRDHDGLRALQELGHRLFGEAGGVVERVEQRDRDARTFHLEGLFLAGDSDLRVRGGFYGCAAALFPLVHGDDDFGRVLFGGLVERRRRKGGDVAVVGGGFAVEQRVLPRLGSLGVLDDLPERDDLGFFDLHVEEGFDQGEAFPDVCFLDGRPRVVCGRLPRPADQRGVRVATRAQVLVAFGSQGVREPQTLLALGGSDAVVAASAPVRALVLIFEAEIAARTFISSLVRAYFEGLCSLSSG